MRQCIKFYRSVIVNYCQNKSLLINYLLADAEGGEYGLEEGVGGYGTGDGAEVVDGFAEVLGYQGGGEVCCQAFFYAV